jgi:ribosome recycling factor
VKLCDLAMISFWLRRRLHLPRTGAFPLQIRYAAKLVDTNRLVPLSQQPITDEIARANYAQTEEKMQGIVEWFRKDCATTEARASGHVTPAVLDPVRVKLPGATTEFRLDEVATVGVRNGTSLVITVFEEQVREQVIFARFLIIQNMKHVEGAIYEGKIPNIVPQRRDSRTIYIPIPMYVAAPQLSYLSTRSGQQRKQNRKL